MKSAVLHKRWWASTHGCCDVFCIMYNFDIKWDMKFDVSRLRFEVNVNRNIPNIFLKHKHLGTFFCRKQPIIIEVFPIDAVTPQIRNFVIMISSSTQNAISRWQERTDHKVHKRRLKHVAAYSRTSCGWGVTGSSRLTNTLSVTEFWQSNC